MGTFHSVFARVLRSEAHHLGYPNSFTIYDTDDSKSLISQVVKEMGLDEPGLNTLIRAAYKLLDLETFFTAA